MLEPTIGSPPREPEVGRQGSAAADRPRTARVHEPLAWLLVAAMTVAAALLRLDHISRVPLDPFYDAAVKSMTLSWHNFFFGAMEPGGSVSIDKPPIDLWLQVASVKLFGFSATGLMLPEALAGTASVPLMFAAVRRIWNTRAGLAAALAIAVLPIEVITSRSDTMDAVMMSLVVLAMLLIGQAGHTGRSSWLLLAAASLGLAFDVKLFESAVALPGLAVFAYLALPGSRRRRIVQLLAAAGVYLAVALAWLFGTLLFPAHERPYAYGSSNGSAWNAALVYNGLNRLEGKSMPGQSVQGSEGPGSVPPSRYGQLTQTERDHIPLSLPSVGRLLNRVGPLSGERLGLELLAALLLGFPAFAFELRDRRRRSGPDPEPADPSTEAAPSEAAAGASETAARVRLAALAGLLLWLVMGTVLFSQMAHLHPRYTEGFTPAVAATLGIGLAWATAARSRARMLVLAVALVVLVGYSEQLLFGTTGVWWVMFLCAIGALALAAFASGPLRAGALVLALLSVLAIPIWASLRAVRDNVSDTNRLGVLAPSELAALSSYLRAHQGSARYEAAYDSASKMGSLVVQDARALVVLNTVDAQVVTPLARLRALAAAGEVRYAILSSLCGPHTARSDADCSASARWVAANGIDVSRQAHVGRNGVLWLLPGPYATALAAKASTHPHTATGHAVRLPLTRRRGQSSAPAAPPPRPR